MDFSPPRPTRPRSWCNWLRPKRSACSITISEALGTSTPTSITVVLTNTAVPVHVADIIVAIGKMTKAKLTPAVIAGALGYAAYSVCLLVGQAFVDRLNARFGAVVLIRAGSMLGLIAVIIIITAQTPDRGLLGFALLGLSVAPFLPLAFTAAAAHDPDRSGRAIARINVFSYFGILLGAPLIGAVADSFSLRVAFALLITAPVVALAVARAYRTSGV